MTVTTETLKQIHELEAAGADIVRVSVPDIPSSAAMKEICNNVSVLESILPIKKYGETPPEIETNSEALQSP